MATPQKRLSIRLTMLSLLASLPLALLSGEAVATDFDKPVFMYQTKLAHSGNAKAQYFLAQMYEQGRGTKVDAEQAAHWYEQAKRNGYVPAQEKSKAN